MATSLKEKINEDLKQAMRGGDAVRRDVLRQALAAFQKTEDERRAALSRASLAKQAELSAAEIAALAAQAALGDSDVLGVLQKEVRQRQESILAFKQGNRPDLAAREDAEMAILQEYLPEQAGRDEIIAEVQRIIAEVGAKGPSDKSKVMPRVIAALKGKADGREINEVVTELLKG